MNLKRCIVAGIRPNEGSLTGPLNQAMEAIDLRGIVKSDMRVFVKPNYTLPFHKPGVTTHGHLIEEVLGILKDRASEVFVGESDGGNNSFTAEDSLRNHALDSICGRTGAEILNLSRIERRRVKGCVSGMEVEVTVPSRLLKMDLTVSMPVLKVHVVTGVSLSMKNMWGCHPDTMRLLEHKNIDRKLVLLCRLLRARLAVIDALYGLNERGPMDGVPVRVGAILVGDNPVATDAVATRLMGLDPERISHINMAAKSGLGPMSDEEITREGDFSAFTQSYTCRPNLVDRVGSLTFRSEMLARTVFSSRATRGIYRLSGRTYQKKIINPGDEL